MEALARTLEPLWTTGRPFVVGALGLFALVFFLGELRGAPRSWIARIVATARKTLIAAVGLVVVGCFPALVGLAAGSWIAGLAAPLVLAIALDRILAARPLARRPPPPLVYLRRTRPGGVR